MTTEMDRHDQYVTAFIRGEEKGLQQGRAEGEAKGRAEAAKLICEKLGLPSEKVAEILGLRPPTE